MTIKHIDPLVIEESNFTIEVYAGDERVWIDDGASSGPVRFTEDQARLLRDWLNEALT